MRLLTSLRSEILKTKRTAAFYFTLIGALPIPAIFLLNILTGGSDLEAVKHDPLNAIFEMGTERNGIMFFPMFVILVCTLLPQIEFRNNTWKQVFAAPQTKANIFIAKFLNINFLIFVFLIVNLLYMTLAIIITHFVVPSLNLLQQPFDGTRLLLRTANAYVTMLAVCAFQFWLGLRFRNFLVPTALGLALWFTGMMMTFEFKSPAVDFFPYSFQTFPYVTSLQSKLPQAAWISVGYAAMFLVLGFLDLRRRRLTS